MAFIAGLALAWYAKWETTDLVWSLWLSSLMVGYAMILWSIFSPGIFIARRMFSDSDPAIRPSVGAVAGGATAYLVGALFLLAFFTVHFGMFHYVHSVFLYSFFPVGAGRASMPDAAVYRAVLTAYWPFVLLALIAERPAFRWPGADAAAVDLSVTPKSIAARKAANAGKEEWTAWCDRTGT